MKVLVATTQTQGLRADDFCWAVDGELVLGGTILECCVPDSCGCGRAFPGLASSKSTTTAMIVEHAHIDRATLAAAVVDSLGRQGWLAECTPAEVDQGAVDELALIERITEAFPVGTVVGRTDTLVYPRSYSLHV